MDINPSHFSAIKYLITSDSNPNIETITSSILYGNIRSLIISRNDCDTLLHHLVCLSSIRELTLSNSNVDTSFIHFLNAMTRLESLRLMEESEKILLLLKKIYH